MKIYNTLIRQKKNHPLSKEGKLRVYICSPTVYDYIHDRPTPVACVFDVFPPVYGVAGWNVRFVQISPISTTNYPPRERRRHRIDFRRYIAGSGRMPRLNVGKRRFIPRDGKYR